MRQLILGGCLALALALTRIFSLPAHAQFETRGSFFAAGAGGGDPYSMTVGDFNHDGKPDVAVIVDERATGTLKIFLGNGDGTFRMGANYTVGLFPFYAVAASLRNNGILDLVFNDKLSDDIWVMLGNGDGTFQPAVPYATTAESYMVALGDFTGKGNLDIVTIEGPSTQGVSCNCIEVLPGNGDGTFGVPISTTTVPYNIDGFTVTVGDFNDDGKTDVAVSGGFFATEQVDILLGNGDGTLTPDVYYQIYAYPANVATGHFTSDKTKLDLAFPNEGTSVMLGNGDGTFQQPAPYNASLPSWVVAEDMNGDGKIDLVVSDSGAPYQHAAPGVSVLNGNGDGTFQNAVFYPVGAGYGGQFVAAGDFNGDRRPDLLVLDSVHGYITTLLNTGVASFSPTTPLNFGKQTVGTNSNPQTVTLTNTGSTTLRIASMKASSEFAVTSTCGSSVAAGAKCTISATFSPTQKGAKQGTITINDSASSKPQVIELLGTGT